VSGYALPSAATLAGPAVALVVALVLPCVARVPRAVAWALFAALVGAATWWTRDAPAGNRMLALSATMFFGMKLVVTTAARHAGRPLPRGGAWVAFHVLWVGMRPWAFAGPRRGPRPGAPRLVALGIASITVGAGLLAAARALTARAWPAPLTAALALLGLGLVVHFGILRALAGLWRALGVAVGPVCDAPHRARSLAAFWSRRWNQPFSEMMQVAVERPLRSRFGTPAAVAGVFVLSGLLHEVALSVPARGGYGLPFAYFALHGLLVLWIEPRLRVAKRRPALARTWVAAWVLLPVVLLFHPPFVATCIQPLLGHHG